MQDLIVTGIALVFGSIGFTVGLILGASAGYSAGKDTLRIYYGPDDDDDDFFEEEPYPPATPASNYRDN